MFQNQNSEQQINDCLTKQITIDIENLIWLQVTNQLKQILFKTDTNIEYQGNDIYMTGNHPELIRIALNEINYYINKEFQIEYILKPLTNNDSSIYLNQLYGSRNYKKMVNLYQGFSMLTIEQLSNELQYIRQQYNYNGCLNIPNYDVIAYIWVPVPIKRNKQFRELYKQFLFEIKGNCQNELLIQQKEAYRWISFNVNVYEMLLIIQEFEFKEIEKTQQCTFGFFDNNDDKDLITIRIKSNTMLKCEQIKSKFQELLKYRLLQLCPYNCDAFFEDPTQLLSDLNKIIKKRTQFPVYFFTFQEIIAIAKDAEKEFGITILSKLKDVTSAFCLFIQKQTNDEITLPLIKELLYLRQKYIEFEKQKQKQILNSKLIQNNIFNYLNQPRFQQQSILLQQDSLVIYYMLNFENSQINYFWNQKDFLLFKRKHYIHLENITIDYINDMIEFRIQNYKRYGIKQKEFQYCISNYMNYSFYLIKDFVEISNFDQIKQISQQYQCDIYISRSNTIERGIIENLKENYITFSNNPQGTAIIFKFQNVIHSQCFKIIRKIKDIYQENIIKLLNQEIFIEDSIIYKSFFNSCQLLLLTFQKSNMSKLLYTQVNYKYFIFNEDKAPFPLFNNIQTNFSQFINVSIFTDYVFSFLPNQTIPIQILEKYLKNYFYGYIFLLEINKEPNSFMKKPVNLRNIQYFTIIDQLTNVIENNLL